MNVDIVLQEMKVSLKDRELRNNHKGAIVWLTGLSASGKSTIAVDLERKLFDRTKNVYVLDGDNIRHGINSDLDFSKDSRTENIRRVGEIAKLFMDSGCIIIISFISPFNEDRKIVRESVTKEQFVEVFVDCPLEVCEQRDPKGLYKKARDGKILDFTGIDSPYEKPLNPEISINTDQLTISESVEKINNYLEKNGLI